MPACGTFSHSGSHILKCRFTYIRVNENTNLCIELFVEFSLAAYAKIVVLRLPVGMLIVSQTRVGSSHGVLGTLTVAGEIMKLVRMIRPPRSWNTHRFSNLLATLANYIHVTLNLKPKERVCIPHKKICCLPL